MIDANKIRKERRDDFNAKFNFEAFDSFVEEHFTKKPTSLYIGLQSIEFVNTYGDGSVSFVKDKVCQSWKTEIQIPLVYYKELLDYVKSCGFEASCMRNTGYSNPGVIVINI